MTASRKGVLAMLLALALILSGCSLDVVDPSGTPDPTASDEVGEGGEPGRKPSTLPYLHNWLFGSESAFRAPIGESPRVDPDSEAYVSFLRDAGGLFLRVREGSVTLFATDQTATFRATVELECADDWGLGVSQLGGVGIPDFATPSRSGPAGGQGSGEASDDGCGERPGPWSHMVVVDGPSRCMYEFWHPRQEGVLWSARWVSAIPIGSDGFHDGGPTHRSSGAALMAGVVWPQELKDGVIPHKLAFSYPFVRRGGPVGPATGSDGTSDDPRALPAGAVLQLDPALDLDTLGLDWDELVVARALQEYGMILVDGGEDRGIGLYAVDPESVEGEPYANTLPDQDVVSLDGIPLEHMRVLELPDQVDPRSARSLPRNRCADYR